MADSFNSGKALGTALVITGLALAAVAVAWLMANVLSGALQPGGFVLGLFFLTLFILPMVLVGIFLRRRGAAEAAEVASFEERRKLFEGDRILRQTLRRESGHAAELVGSRASQLQGEASELLKQVQRVLEGLAEEASQPVGEADWLHAAFLGPQDVRDVERYDDLLLAGGAVTLGTSDYLVTAHITYFAEGRRWDALILRGEEGER